MKGTGSAIVLLSGGLDSAVTAAMIRAEGYDVHALTVSYGQRHAVEIEKARRLAAFYGFDHVVTTVDLLSAIGGSALTSGDTSVPKDTAPDGIPPTYVPARNTILLSLALAWAEVMGTDVVALGINAIDYSGYPDCRPEYLAAFQRVATLGTRRGVERGDAPRIVAPLSGLTKADIIRRGATLGVPFELTHSCYDPEGARACGRCDSCRIRRRGFAEADVVDPVPYVGDVAPQRLSR